MKKDWIPAFAGMTFLCYFVSQGLVSIPTKVGIQMLFLFSHKKTGFLQEFTLMKMGEGMTISGKEEN